MHICVELHVYNIKSTEFGRVFSLEVLSKCPINFVHCRLFVLDEISETLKHIGSSKDSGNCMLTVKHIRVMTSIGEQVLVFTGATDGSVSVWSTDEVGSQLFQSMSFCSMCKNNSDLDCEEVTSADLQMAGTLSVCRLCGKQFTLSMEVQEQHVLHTFAKLHQSGVNSLDIQPSNG